MSGQIWTDQQFEEMSWHDNHVHGLRIEEGEYGSGELALDLDYIVEALCDGARYTFRIVPVYLRFLGVTNLRVVLAYSTPTAALGPFSIHAIERRNEVRERYVAQLWKIAINWPQGEIVFEAKGFDHPAMGTPLVSELQRLRPEERKPRA